VKKNGINFINIILKGAKKCMNKISLLSKSILFRIFNTRF